MYADEQVQIRFGRLCSLVTAAIKYGVADRECIVDEVAASKAAECIQELVKRGEVRPLAQEPTSDPWKQPKEFPGGFAPQPVKTNPLEQKPGEGKPRIGPDGRWEETTLLQRVPTTMGDGSGPGHGVGCEHGECATCTLRPFPHCGEKFE